MQLAADNHLHPHHAHWDAGRSFVENLFPEQISEGQDLAYNAYI